MSERIGRERLDEILENHRMWWASGGKEGVRANLVGANLEGANLYGANLTRANLTHANLDGANLDSASLCGANLTRANLTHANLDGASLYGANLEGANLYGANLYGANLYGANLVGADLVRANLEGANLVGANLDGANLYGANLYGANLEGANLYGANLDGIPVVPSLFTRTLERIESNPACFEMGDWHSACGTVHCMAGHFIDLAGEAGYDLETMVGPACAGTLIALASNRWLRRTPNFYASNEDALHELRGLAAEEKRREAGAS